MRKSKNFKSNYLPFAFIRFPIYYHNSQIVSPIFVVRLLDGLLSLKVNVKFALSQPEFIF